MVLENDWRRMGQEKYLMGVELFYVCQYHAPRPNWEHEHCEFCFEKIAEYEGCQHSGYCTIDRCHWICEQCFRDFQEEFHFQLKKDPAEEKTMERRHPYGTSH